VRPLTDYELLPESINHLLDDLVALLDNTDTRQLRKEIAAGELERDLGVYFYEHYYTPPELVRYLVRATHEVLIQHFGLSRGLADSHVILLDPAAGTGTFVLGAAEQALAVEKSRGTARQASSALCETIYSQISMDSSCYPLPTPLHI